VLKLPVMPATEPMLTIEPPPESLISGAQVWMPRRVAVTLISKTLLSSSMSTCGKRTSVVPAPPFSAATSPHGHNYLTAAILHTHAMGGTEAASDDDASYLDEVERVSFDGVEWTAERLRETRDFLAPWQHNIRLPHGVFTAYTEDYYDEHRRITGKRVLDLGCLEGYFSAECALHGAHVVGVDARVLNVKKCELVRSALELRDTTFVVDDALAVTRERYGGFHVVLALGLLYHLSEPLAFLSNLAELCDSFAVIDTLVAIEDGRQEIDGWRPELSDLQRFELGGETYEGRLYREYEPGADRVERELSTTASLANDLSVWLTEDSLVRMLGRVGFAHVLKVRFAREADNWWSDPAEGRVLVVASKEPRPFRSLVFASERS
jgi:SAM-dependent methyltransferase